MGLILLWLLHAAVSVLQPQMKNTPKKLHATQATGYYELLNKQAPFYYIIFLYWKKPMEDAGGCTWVYFNASNYLHSLRFFE